MFNKDLYFDIGVTPLCQSAVKAMAPFWQEKFGNPESVHQAGQEARKILEESRLIMADLIGANRDEIFFTSSATESDNWAIKGIALNHYRETAGRLKRNKILISAIEHPAIRAAAKSLTVFGFKIITLPVDGQGLIQIDKLKEHLDQQTLLVSIMAANNQFGSIQDLAILGKEIKRVGAIFHTDAAVFFGLHDLPVKTWQIDLATISSPKIYGPKGVAVLYKRHDLKIEPLLHGGGQELGLRSGTHNLPAIVGLIAAAQETIKNRQRYLEKYQKLSAYFEESLNKKLKGIIFNGEKKNRLANNVHLSILGVEGEALVLSLNEYGICASSGSACSSRSLQADETLQALNLSPEAVHGSLRFFWHPWTNKKMVEYLIEKIVLVVERLRSISAYKFDEKP